MDMNYEDMEIPVIHPLFQVLVQHRVLFMLQRLPMCLSPAMYDARAFVAGGCGVFTSLRGSKVPVVGSKMWKVRMKVRRDTTMIGLDRLGGRKQRLGPW